MKGSGSTVLLELLPCLLLLINLLPLQVASSLIAEVLGQGLKQSALHHQSRKTCGGGGGRGLPIEGKELGWKEYSLTDNDGKQYKFREYEPEVFCRLREHFQIDSDNFYASLTGSALKDWENPAKSGSAFVTTADGHFMLKSLWVKQNEPKVFQERFSSYFHYMSRHPNSFVTRYLGYYSVQEGKNGPVQWFVCMANILANPRQIGHASTARVDVRFDMKGFRFQRLIDANEWKKPEPTFKEWEFNGEENGQALFKGGILLGDKFYREIAEIISEDAKFLSQQQNIVDYSLFLGIHFNEKEEEREEAKEISSGHFQRMANGGIPASCIGCKKPKEHLAIAGPEEGSAAKQSISIFLGIVDLLSAWEWHDKLEAKCLHDRKCRETNQSFTSPANYAARFKCFFNTEVFHVENEEAMKGFKEKYCADYKNADWTQGAK